MRNRVRCLALLEAEAAASKAAKTAQSSLDAKVLARYGRLTEQEIKTLVVCDKWLTAICGALASEVERLGAALSNRVQELDERYAAPLPKLTREAEARAAQVDEQLKRMGAVWK